MGDAPTSEAPTSPTPTPPLSTRCTGAPTLWLRLPAPRFPAPADGLPRLATLSAVKPRSQERRTMQCILCILWRSMESVEVVKRARSWVVLIFVSCYFVTYHLSHNENKCFN